MKKIVATFIICAFLTGCGKSDSTNNTLENNKINDNTKVSNIEESYTKYNELKEKVYTKLDNAINDDEGYNLSLGMGMVGFASMDLSLIPVSLCGQEKEAVLSGLSFLYSSVEYNNDKKGCKFSLENKEGEKITYDILYDEKTDSMQTKVYDNGKLSIISEYIKLDQGYGSQFYSVDENASSIYKFIFDEDKIVIGIMNTNVEPESIFKNASSINEEWTMTKELWSKYENGKVTSIIDGKEI